MRGATYVRSYQKQMTDMDRQLSLVEKIIKTYINIKLPSTRVGSEECKINRNLGTSAIVDAMANCEHCGPELRMSRMAAHTPHGSQRCLGGMVHVNYFQPLPT